MLPYLGKSTQNNNLRQCIAARTRFPALSIRYHLHVGYKKPHIRPAMGETAKIESHTMSAGKFFGVLYCPEAFQPTLGGATADFGLYAAARGW